MQSHRKDPARAPAGANGHPSSSGPTAPAPVASPHGDLDAVLRTSPVFWAEGRFKASALGALVRVRGGQRALLDAAKGDAVLAQRVAGLLDMPGPMLMDALAHHSLPLIEEVHGGVGA